MNVLMQFAVVWMPGSVSVFIFAGSGFTLS